MILIKQWDIKDIIDISEKEFSMIIRYFYMGYKIKNAKTLTDEIWDGKRLELCFTGIDGIDEFRLRIEKNILIHSVFYNSKKPIDEKSHPYSIKSEVISEMKCCEEDLQGTLRAMAMEYKLYRE